jgi:hypothetical protein
MISHGGKMAKFDPKIILDDVRSRDVALLTILLATDRQAVALFRVYVTLAAALISAAVAGAIKANEAVDVWITVGVGLSASGLARACWYCIVAIKTAKVGMPGKGAEFWQWARRDDISEDVALDAYLNQALTAQDTNIEVNRRSSNCLRMAKRLGVGSVALGAIVLLIGLSGFASTAWEALSRLL